MDIVLIVGLFCALIFLTHVSDKNDEKLQPSAPPTPPLPPPSPKRFVSVVFNEGDKKTYDYFFEDNLNLMVNDFVEVPVMNKFSGRSEYKIVKVQYVSAPGERSAYAWATVIRRVPPPPQKVYIPPPPPVYTPQPTRTVSPPAPIYTPQPTQPRPSSPPPIQPTPPSSAPYGKQFVQVIFKKRSKKRYDYFLGETQNVHVGDFVVVHVNINGKNTWKIAKVMYISSPGEISIHAKSPIIKKADYPKW